MATESIVNDQDIATLCAMDPVFARLLNECGPPPRWRREPSFRSLCQIILEQQVSLESARAHFNTLSAFLPSWNPSAILDLTDEQMRRCQVSRQKTTYLRELATAIRSGGLNLSSLEEKSDQEIRTALTAVKGIGHWTVDIYLMFCLQRKDLFPLGDIAVIHAVKGLYAVQDKEEIVKLSQGWQPLRSLAAYFFWHHYLVRKGKKIALD